MAGAAGGGGGWGSLIGLGIQAAGTVMQTNSQTNAAQQEAQNYENQAAALQTANTINTNNIATQSQAAQGAVAAALGASGVDTSSGSSVSDVSTTAANYAREIYADNFATANNVNALYASANRAISQGQIQNENSLFNLGGSVVKSGALQNMDFSSLGGLLEPFSSYSSIMEGGSAADAASASFGAIGE